MGRLHKQRVACFTCYVPLVVDSKVSLSDLNTSVILLGLTGQDYIVIKLQMTNVLEAYQI